MKKFIFLSLILTSSFFILGCDKQSAKTEQINSTVQTAINVTINSEKYNTTFTQGETALDILQKISDDNNLNIKIQGQGKDAYIQSIQEKAAGTDNKYWMFYVNGKLSDVGVGQYELKSNDNIELKYEAF